MTHQGHEDESALADADLVVSLGSSVAVSRTGVDWVAREHRLLPRLIARGTPVLGICFGAQMISSVIGGAVTKIGTSYVGWFENDSVAAPVWIGPWFRLHMEQCRPPDSTEVLARSYGTVQAFQFKRAIGLQFHPEMDATIVENSLASIQSDFGTSTTTLDGVLAETRGKSRTDPQPPAMRSSTKFCGVVFRRRRAAGLAPR